MESLITTLPQLSFVETVRFSRWGYASINAAHILCFSVLIGSLTVMNLRLMGLWSFMDRDKLVRALSPLLMISLSGAVIFGLTLFATRAPEYVQIEVFLLKMTLIGIAMVHGFFAHFKYGAHLQMASAVQAQKIGLTSLCLWLSILISGRLIAFAD